MIDLERMRYLMRKIPDLKWDVERRMANATRITSVLTGMPGGSGKNQKMEAAIIALVQVKKAYREAIAELDAMRQELTPLIDALEDPDEKAVMRLRYLDGHTPDEIAQMVNRARSGVYMYLTRAERQIRRAAQNG